MRPKDHTDHEDRMGYAEFYNPRSPIDHSLLAARWRLLRVHLAAQPEAARALRDGGLEAWYRVCEPHPTNTLLAAYYLWSVHGLSPGRNHAWAREGLRAVNAHVVGWLRDQPWPRDLAPVAHWLFALGALNALADWDYRGRDVAPRDLKQRLVHIQDIPDVDYDRICRLPPDESCLHYYPSCEFWADAEKRFQRPLTNRQARQRYKRAVEAVYLSAGWRQTPTKRRRVLTPQLQFEHAYAYLTTPGVPLEELLEQLGTSIAASSFRQNVGSILEYVLCGTGIPTPFRPPKSLRAHADVPAF